MSNESNRKRLSRRNLLLGLGAGIGAAGLSSLNSVRAASLPKGKSSETHDVIVIGMGMAGSAAALQAKLDGADVIVLDKVRESRVAGNSRVAGGMLITPLEDSSQARQDYFDALMQKTQGRGNSSIFHLLADHSAEGIAWLKEQGVQMNPMIPQPPYLVGGHTVAPELYHGMPNALAALRKKFTGLGGKIAFETKAKQLILDDRGKVVGVRATGPAGIIDYLANAVVITTGGYAANKFILEEFVDPNADVMMVRGSKWATGDGLLMAQEVGAGVSGMAGVASLHISAVSPSEPAAGNPFPGVPYFLGINRDGKRYVDESKGYVAHGKAALKQPGQKVALIFDSEIAKQQGAQLSIATFNHINVPIVEADTLEELATKIEVPPAQLTATVKAFNDTVKDGKALEADPPKATLAFKVETGKFYAFYPLVPGITLSFGGLMIDGRAQVLEADSAPIGGLYAAGETAGAVYWDDYIGGGSLTNCLVMGRIAGSSAAKDRKKA